jgi:hypothetical protein
MIYVRLAQREGCMLGEVHVYWQSRPQRSGDEVVGGKGGF